MCSKLQIKNSFRERDSPLMRSDIIWLLLYVVCDAPDLQVITDHTSRSGSGPVCDALDLEFWSGMIRTLSSGLG
ncbi:hypothetical protein NHX12_002371 [Muraenolepis orangiensis]|uniref:Uncharacterized protein n=1 Tax=Muraenolepis orangiensis TaxID=630683 RepID=A0A9Q0ID05_9TELE|nr:hypothetical protein NHX12_002371 [Muraenolepis orangiensis]